MKKIEACKPCHILKYCPYGPLVEDFELVNVSELERCSVFGHKCPVYEVSEAVQDTAPRSICILIWNEPVIGGNVTRQEKKPEQRKPH